MLLPRPKRKSRVKQKYRRPGTVLLRHCLLLLYLIRLDWKPLSQSAMEEPVSAPPSEPEPEPEPSVAPSEPVAQPDPLPREPTDGSLEPPVQSEATGPAVQPDPIPREPSIAPAAQTNSVPPEPETVPPAPPVERARKKRKLEEVGFENSTYFKIRTIVKNLRPSFVQVNLFSR